MRCSVDPLIPNRLTIALTEFSRIFRCTLVKMTSSFWYFVVIFALNACDFHKQLPGPLLSSRDMSVQHEVLGFGLFFCKVSGLRKPQLTGLRGVSIVFGFLPTYHLSFNDH